MDNLAAETFIVVELRDDAPPPPEGDLAVTELVVWLWRGLERWSEAGQQSEMERYILAAAGLALELSTTRP